MKTELEDGVYCESLVSHRHGGPLAQITAVKDGEAVILQCDSATARQIGLQLLQCAEAADFDAAIYHGLRGKLDDAAIFNLLRLVRESRGTPVAERGEATS